MPDTKIVVHTAFVLLLPLLVAAFGLSFWTALLLVAAAVLWRWAIVLLGFLRPARGPDLVLESISASHFVEKVRWCLDRLGIEYTEEPWAGTLGVFFTGRTVPRLNFRTGMVRSRIGNSPEILRYLWGAYAATRGEAAEFLRPTPERLELEQRIDRCGVNLQVWVYYHLLGDPPLCRHAWGADNPATPRWQRRLLVALYPLQALMIRRAFRIDEPHYQKSREHISSFLADVEKRLGDGRRSILGGETLNYTDLAFAAVCGLWLQPENYGAAAGIRLERQQMPRAMQDDVARWIEELPRVTTFITRLYAEQRRATGGRSQREE